MAFNKFLVPFTRITLASAGTAKTILGIQAPSNICVLVHQLKISFNGLVPTAEALIVEWGRCSFATNAPHANGNSTAVTPKKCDPGRDETIQTLCSIDWTNEPTVYDWSEGAEMPEDISPWNGWNHYIIPFAQPFVVPGGGGFACRVTIPTGGTIVKASGRALCEE